jgi:ABC-type Fe3+/spermidine/putrescine transport system ATPase subunit
MLRSMRVTALFVTHDQDDAFAVADRVALLRHGRLLQVGSPETLYTRPASREVAEFIGRATLAPATFANGVGRIAIGGVEQRADAWTAAADQSAAREMLAVLRPELLALVDPAAAGGSGWPGVIVDRHFGGSEFRYAVDLGSGTTVEVASIDGSFQVGHRVGVRIARGPVALIAR